MSIMYNKITQTFFTKKCKQTFPTIKGKQMRVALFLLLTFLPILCKATIYQAENYTTMSGLYLDNPTLDIGGGANMGSWDAGDWAEYTVTIPATAAYSFTWRLANPMIPGAFNLSENNVILDTITVPSTGNWQNWTSTKRPPITLTAGIHVFRIGYPTNPRFNLNWFSIDLPGSEPIVPDFIKPAVVVSSSSAPAVGAATSSIASSAPTASASSKASSSTSSASSPVIPVSSVTITQSTVFFNWAPPTQRENGNPITQQEIGGYEFRYRLTAANTYNYIPLSAIATTIKLDNLALGNYYFEIAVYDTDGLYSSFTYLNPKYGQASSSSSTAASSSKASSSSSSRKFIAAPTNGSIE